MATSGSVNYSTSRDGLIAFALKKAGVVPTGATPSAAQIADAAVELNFLAKAWQADGLQLWAKKFGVCFLAKDQTKYLLGPSGDHATNSYVQTAVTVSAVTSSTSVTLDSVAGIASTYNIGITLDDGSLFWTTVSGSPVGNVVTLASGITDSVSAGAVVFVYATKLNRPLKLLQVLRKDRFGIETTIELQSIDEFTSLPNKTEDGTVTQSAFVPQLVNAELYLWPQAIDVTDVVEFWYHRPFEDFDAGADEPDFPQEWYLALGYSLASALCDTYGVPEEFANKITAKAAYYKDEALSFDQENASVFFQPNENNH